MYLLLELGNARLGLLDGGAVVRAAQTTITSDRDDAHLGRLALLQPNVKALAERAYAQLVRQGLFDCATISCEMLELRGQIVEGEPPPRKVKKLEPAVQLAVECTIATCVHVSTGNAECATADVPSAEVRGMTCGSPRKPGRRGVSLGGVCAQEVKYASE